MYTESDDEKNKLRDQISKSSSHILSQAVTGKLPDHFNSGPINAPFVQIQMLR